MYLRKNRQILQNFLGKYPTRCNQHPMRYLRLQLHVPAPYRCMRAEPSGQFLHQIRRVTTPADFFRVCREFLEHDERMPLEPFELNLPETDLLAGEHR